MDWYKVLEQIPGLKYQPGDKIPLYKDINGGLIYHVWKITPIPAHCVEKIQKD